MLNPSRIALFVFGLFIICNAFALPLDFSLSSDVDGNTVCVGQEVTIYGLITGGYEPYTVTCKLGGTQINTTVDDNEFYTVATFNSEQYLVVMVEDAAHVKHRDSIQIHVVTKSLTVDFLADPISPCSGEGVLFSPSVSNYTGTLSYTWYKQIAGDYEFFSDHKNPTTSFEAYGCGGTVSKNVQVDVSDGNKCTGSRRKAITIKEQPELSFTDSKNPYSPFSNCLNNPSPANPNFSVTLSNQSAAAACITGYSVDWGDGTTTPSATFPLSHTYTSLGAFDLVVTGTSNAGCDGLFQTTVKNQSNPAVGVTNLGNTIGCEPITYQFQLTGYENNSPQTSYLIDFGDGTTDVWDYDDPFSNDIISHNYKKSSCLTGTQFILTVTAQNTCEETSATASGIKVWDSPEANVTLGSYYSSVSSDTICVDELVYLYNRTLAGNYGPSCSNLTNYNWVIPGRDTIKLTTNAFQTTSFDTPGTYVIELWSENPCGASKDEVQVVVIEPPVANATVAPLSGCAPLVVNTNNLSTGEYLDYYWSISPNQNYLFKNGTDRYTKNPQIEFTKSGTYTLTLRTSNNCNYSTKTFTVNVTSTPVLKIDAIDDFCRIATLTPGFTSSSSAATSFQWFFEGANPSTSTVASPTGINYSTSGNYWVKLIGSNTCGSSSDSIEFEIAPPAEVVTFNADICNTAPAVSAIAATVHTLDFSWSSSGTGYFDDAENTTTIYNLSSTDKTLDSILLVATAIGHPACGNAVDTLAVRITPAPAINAGPDLTVCMNSDFLIQHATAKSYKQVYWQALGDGSFNDSSSLSPTYHPGANDFSSKSTRLVLVATSNAPCVVTVRDTINVTFNNPPEVYAGSDTSLCAKVLSMSASHVLNTSNFAWTHDGTGSFNSSSVIHPDYTISTADYQRGYINLYLSATVLGCESARDTVHVVLPPVPTLAQPLTDRVCEDAIYPLTINANNFAEINLTSSGDGHYTNEHAATGAYTPGANDILTSKVTLYTQITGNVPCNSTLIDSTELAIIHLPTVDPLADRIIGDTDNLLIDFAIADNYQQLKWETDGTGSFTNQSLLNTTYQPSQMDRSNEVVNIWLKAFSQTPCDASLAFASDTFELRIVPKPIINAGIDYTICEGSNFVMPLNHASAERFSKLYWETNGTGVLTQDSTLTPVYTPSGSDISEREVVLFLNARGEYPIDDITVIDSMVLHIMHNANIDIAARDTFCENQSYIPVGYSNSDIASILWSFSSSDGSIIGASSSAPEFLPGTADITNGSMEVYVKVTSLLPCVANDFDTTELTIFHEPQPIFDFSPKSGCGPLTVMFTNSSVGEELLYQWNFGDFSNDTHIIPDPVDFNAGIIADTTYTVLLSASNRCATKMSSQSVVVQSSPTALFAKNPSWGCSPVIINFQNNSLGLPDNYHWDFGDGSGTVGVKEPGAHVFTTADTNSTYTITLITTNNCGKDTITDVVRVFPNTVEAFFTADTTLGCAPLAVQFRNYSRGAVGSEPFLEWSWNFGDGQITDQRNPIHVFEKPGVYPVQLFVNDSCAYDTATVMVRVLGAPEVEFAASTLETCVGDTIGFEPIDFDITKVGDLTWHFGDGTSISATEPWHCYDTAGKFAVQLVATDINTGCSSATKKDILIHPNPSSQFLASTTAGCIPLKVSFANQTSLGNYYVWNFADGSGSVDENPEHTYSIAGKYRVKLVATSTFGCADSTTSLIIANPKPTSSFELSSNQSCFYPVTVNTNNTSSGADAYYWQVAPGYSSDQTNIEVEFGSTGNYLFNLVSLNQFGCTDTATFIYSVYDNPVPAFTVEDPVGCDPYKVQFNNTSQYGLNWVWYFNENDTSHAENPVFTFEGPGVYTVGLIAIGAGNCSDSIFIDEFITVNPTPEADFEHQRINDADTVQFYDYSSGAIAQVWFFGDGDSSHVQNPLHRYPTYGIFNTALVVENEYGCTDTLVKEIDLDFYKGLFLPNAMAPSNAEEGVRWFTPTGIGLSSFHIVVYDVWGNKLWESTSLDNGRPNESWDGTNLDGKPMPPDTYFWHITEASFKDGSQFKGERYGIIHIIK